MFNNTTSNFEFEFELIHNRTSGLTSTVTVLAAEAIQTRSSEDVRNYRPRLKWLSTLVPKLFLELLLPGLHRTQFKPIYTAMIPPEVKVVE